MDDFTQQYLLCESNSATESSSPLANIAFVPGPPVVREPISVADLDHTVDYTLTDIMTTFEALPHVESSAETKALRWSMDDRWINIDFNVSDQEWTGSKITCCCTFSDVIWMWLALCRTHRAVMLKNAQGQLFTPRSFLHELAFPKLGIAFNDENESIRNRAEEEMRLYQLVARDALR